MNRNQPLVMDEMNYLPHKLRMRLLRAPSERSMKAMIRSYVYHGVAKRDR